MTTPVQALSDESKLTPIVAALCGRVADWPTAPAQRDRMMQCAAYHGVCVLLYRALAFDEASEIVNGLRPIAIAAAAQERLRRHAIAEVLAALAAEHIEALVLKGSALAYWLYAAPECRSRADTDLLIKQADLPGAIRVFAALGYSRAAAVSGQLLSTQYCYERKDLLAAVHGFDLHWQVSNTRAMAEVFSYTELRAAAMPLARLSENALALGRSHSLLLACMHRLAHQQAPYYFDGVARRGGERLIWLFDIHLLSLTMTAEDWRATLSIAVSKGLQAVLLDGLRAVQAVLSTTIPTWVQEELAVAWAHAKIEPRSFTVAPWRWDLSEIARQPDWSARWRLVKEHLLPPPAYMLAKYRTHHRSLLPLLYVRRALSGFVKRL